MTILASPTTTSNPYLAILLPVVILVEQAGFFTTLSYEQKTKKLIEWRTLGSQHFSAASPIAESWVMARDALITKFLARNRCNRCLQTPLIFPATYTLQLAAHHRLPTEAKNKFDGLLREMDTPPEMLNREVLEGFAEKLRVIENLFWESTVGERGCGLGTWSGYRAEVEI